MSKVEDFLTKSEENEIIEAIRLAELNTSGEIRVHLEKTTSKAHYDRAVEVFNFLKMYETKDRNGVLIYVAVNDKQFVICGDEGINNKVTIHFWDDVKSLIQEHFRNGNFKEGLVQGILKAGEQLKSHFPHKNNDIDELTNEISFGE